MKKFYATAGFSPNYDQNGISDDQTDTYIDTDPNENSAIAGIKTYLTYHLNNIIYECIVYLFYAVILILYRRVFAEKKRFFGR